MLTSRFTISAALACALLAACGHSTETSTATTTTQTTTAQSNDDSQTFGIVKTKISKEENGDRVTSLSTTDSAVWCKASFNHPKAGQTIAFQLIYTKDGNSNIPLSTMSTTTDETSDFAEAHFTNDKPWPAGAYTMKISINGTDVAGEDFTMQ